MIKIIKSVYDRIKNTSSRNEKEAILAEFKDNEDVINAFKFTFNDLIVTGLSTKKINKSVNVTTDKQLTNLQDAMNYLIENNTGTDLDVFLIQDFIYRVADNEEEIQFLKQFFTKTYKMGVKTRTLNKVFGKSFVFEFGCMLGENFEKSSHVIKDDFYITIKLDGQRLIGAVDERGSVKFFSRSGKLQNGLFELENYIKAFSNENILSMKKYNKGFVFDGEILASDPNIPKDKTCAETISIMSSKEESKTGLTYHVFDIISLDEFAQGKSDDKYSVRRATLDKIAKHTDPNLLQVVPLLYHGNDKGMIAKLLDEVESQGEEGLMINLDDYYQTKRVKSLIKVKSFNTSDLRVVDTFDGEGRLEGKLGGAVVEYKGNKVKVGSGFTDYERETLTKDDLVGKIVEVKYFSESTNKENDEISLRFPTFVRIRTDKEEPNE